MPEPRKTGDKGYEVVVDGRTVGQVWSWHGSCSARMAAGTSRNLKSRKQALERVENVHRNRGV